MSKKKILITGGGGSGAEAINSLVNSKYKLYFADADIKSISSNIKKKVCIKIPYANSPRFEKQIYDICKKLKIEVLVPCVDEELLKFQGLKKKLPKIKIMLPHFDYIETMLDKYKSMKMLKKKGIQVPQTYLTSQNFNLKAPFIIKPRWGRGSKNVMILKNKKEIDSYLKLTGMSKKNSVVQEKIDGLEYTVTMVADTKGKLAKIIPILVELKKGITIRAKIDWNSNIISACRKIHEKLPTKSTYNIQLKMKSNGQIFPFEINPRISTTFCLVLANGYNPFAVFLNEKKNKLKNIGNSLKRTWRNEFK